MSVSPDYFRVSTGIAGNERAWRWQGIVAGQARNKCKIKKQK